jgi:hypothetical protein
MGMITDISDTVSVETRRESAAFVIDEAHADENGDSARIEFHYRRVFGLKAGIDTIIASESFQRWLKKQEVL